jgi:hypothetical protein
VIGIADLDLDQCALGVTGVCLTRGVEQRMPLARYFSLVGGVLLALLFILDAWFPKLPVLDRPHANLPLIRIHSDRKWPERIVYATSHSPIVPISMASPEVIIQAPEMVAEASAGPRKLEAFAMLPPSGEQLQASNATIRKLARHQRKIVRKRSPVPSFAMAGRLQFSQFHQFGWSGRSFW